jgi:hypothetical protein
MKLAYRSWSGRGSVASYMYEASASYMYERVRSISGSPENARKISKATHTFQGIRAKAKNFRFAGRILEARNILRNVPGFVYGRVRNVKPKSKNELIFILWHLVQVTRGAYGFYFFLKPDFCMEVLFPSFLVPKRNVLAYVKGGKTVFFRENILPKIEYSENIRRVSIYTLHGMSMLLVIFWKCFEVFGHFGTVSRLFSYRVIFCNTFYNVCVLWIR